MVSEHEFFEVSSSSINVSLTLSISKFVSGELEQILVLELLCEVFHLQSLLGARLGANAATSAVSSGNLDGELGVFWLGFEGLSFSSVFKGFKVLWELLVLLSLSI